MMSFSSRLIALFFLIFCQISFSVPTSLAQNNNNWLYQQQRIQQDAMRRQQEQMRRQELQRQRDAQEALKKSIRSNKDQMERLRKQIKKEQDAQRKQRDTARKLQQKNISKEQLRALQQQQKHQTQQQKNASLKKQAAEKALKFSKKKKQQQLFTQKQKDIKERLKRLERIKKIQEREKKRKKIVEKDKKDAKNTALLLHKDSTLKTKPTNTNHNKATRNDKPYDSRTIRKELERKYGKDNVRSTTVPPSNKPNVKLAGKHKDIMISNGSTVRIVYDKKGFPVFDNVAKYDTRLPIDKFRSASYRQQMRMATHDLRMKIANGVVPRNIFNKTQLKIIESGSDKIPGYTWHHHQDTGRMQLVPEKIHFTAKHIGWESMKDGQ